MIAAEHPRPVERAYQAWHAPSPGALVFCSPVGRRNLRSDWPSFDRPHIATRLSILLDSVPLCLPVWQVVSLSRGAAVAKIADICVEENTLKPVLAMIVVGLTPRHLGALTPRLSALAGGGGMATLDTVTPAVTCSVQATFMTGTPPHDHGVVGNGWLFRDLMEVLLWRQSNRLVSGEKIWEPGKKRDPSFTC